MTIFDEWKELIQKKKYLDASNIINCIKTKDLLSYIQQHPSLSYNTLFMICNSEQFKEKHPVPKLKKCIDIYLSEGRFKSLRLLKTLDYSMARLKMAKILDALEQIKTISKLSVFKQVFDLKELLTVNDKFCLIPKLDKMSYEIAELVLDWLFDSMYIRTSLETVFVSTHRNLAFIRYVHQKKQMPILTKQHMKLLLKNDNLETIQYLSQHNLVFYMKSKIMERALRYQTKYSGLIDNILRNGFDVNVCDDLFINQITANHNLALAHQFVKHGANPLASTGGSNIPNFFDLIIIKRDIELFKEYSHRLDNCFLYMLIELGIRMFSSNITSVDYTLLMMAKIIRQKMDNIEVNEYFDLCAPRTIWDSFDRTLAFHILRTKDIRLYDVLFRDRVARSVEYESMVFEKAVSRGDYETIQTMYEASFHGVDSVWFFCIKYDRLNFLDTCREKTTICPAILLIGNHNFHQFVKPMIDVLLTFGETQSKTMCQNISLYVEQQKIVFTPSDLMEIFSLVLDKLTIARFKPQVRAKLVRIYSLINILLDNSSNCGFSVDLLSSILNVDQLIDKSDIPRKLVKTKLKKDYHDFEVMIARMICQNIMNFDQLSSIQTEYHFCHITKNDLMELFQNYRSDVNDMMRLVQQICPEIYQQEMKSDKAEDKAEFECAICVDKYQVNNSYKCLQCKTHFCKECILSLSNKVRPSCQYCRSKSVCLYSVEREIFIERFCTKSK